MITVTVFCFWSELVSVDNVCGLISSKISEHYRYQFLSWVNF